MLKPDVIMVKPVESHQETKTNQESDEEEDLERISKLLVNRAVLSIVEKRGSSAGKARSKGPDKPELEDYFVLGDKRVLKRNSFLWCCFVSLEDLDNSFTLEK